MLYSESVAEFKMQLRSPDLHTWPLMQATPPHTRVLFHFFISNCWLPRMSRGQVLSMSCTALCTVSVQLIWTAAAFHYVKSFEKALIYRVLDKGAGPMVHLKSDPIKTSLWQTLKTQLTRYMVKLHASGFSPLPIKSLHFEPPAAMCSGRPRRAVHSRSPIPELWQQEWDTIKAEEPYSTSLAHKQGVRRANTGVLLPDCWS